MGWNTGVNHESLDAKEVLTICERLGLKYTMVVDYGIEIYKNFKSSDPILVLQKDGPEFDMDMGGAYQVLTYAYFCELACIPWQVDYDWKPKAAEFNDDYASIWELAEHTREDMKKLGLPFSHALMMHVLNRTFTI